MNKLIVFLVALFGLSIFCANSINAQDSTAMPYTGEARKGKFLLSGGIGFIEGVGGVINVEYGLLGNKRTGALTAGLSGAIMWDEWKVKGFARTIDRTNYSAGFRLAYRYDLISRLEIYVALWTGIIYLEDSMISVTFPNSKYDPTFGTDWGNPSLKTHPNNRLMWQGGGSLGFRYHFSNVVGCYVEAGYAVPIIQGGLAFSL